MIRKTIEITKFFKGYFYPELGYTNMNYYGIMWFASPFFYKSDNAQPEDDTAQLLSETAQLLSETGQPVNSKDGLFHLLNKYIPQFGLSSHAFRDIAFRVIGHSSYPKASDLL